MYDCRTCDILAIYILAGFSKAYALMGVAIYVASYDWEDIHMCVYVYIKFRDHC